MPEEKVLNKEQKQAVEYGAGPLLIIAGAGTGKTTVITERINFLITKKKVSPSEILALTFTEKAALEMQTRVDQVLPLGFTGLWISTFHSFAERILQDEAINIGLDPKYKLLSHPESIQFFRKHLFDFDLSYFRPLGNPTKFIEAILQHFDRLKDEDIEPREYLDWIKKQKPKNEEQKQEIDQYSELAKAFQKYSVLKQEYGLADFSDLIAWVLFLFRKRKNILKKYRQKFKYILVDEFQDTNFSQNQMIMLLAGLNPNLTVVADDDQSIYRWRGAAISNILQFRKTFPKAKIVVLTKNYRSYQEILDKSYLLIQNNNPDRLEIKEGINKKLQAVRKEKAKIKGKMDLLIAENGEKEAEMVIDQILREKKKNKGYAWKDFAILVRANNHSELFTKLLSQKGIPFQFLGPGKLFKEPEIKDLIAYLSILVNFQDNVAMYRLLSMDCFSIVGRDLAGIIIYAKNNKQSLFEACEQVEKISVSKQVKNKIQEITAMIYRHLDFAKKESAGQILYYFLQETNLLKSLLTFQNEEDEKKAKNMVKFFEKIKAFELKQEEPSVYAVLEFINLSLDLGESTLVSEVNWEENDAVNVLTVHSAKGLEFPVVFLVNLVERRFPTTKRAEPLPIPDQLVKEILPEGDFHLQEERRLFYVGMTRAKDKLFLTAANFYQESGQKKKISPFVAEIFGEEFIKEGKNLEKIKTLEISKFEKVQKINISRQSEVRHPVTFLSYSQLDSFTTCPLQYKHRYILSIPTPPSAALAFGNSIHQTMKDFYQRVIAGQNPQKDDFIKILDENWTSLGYPSKAHEEKYKKEGKKILSEFFDKSFDPKNYPLALELKFSVKIGSVLKAGGKIDRIDRVKDDSNEIEIIDYKTGKSSTKKDIDKDIQLTLYALAATDGTLTNQGLLKYIPKPEQVKVSFYFFENQEKISSYRKPEELQNLKETLLQKAEEISQSNFSPQPGKHCDFCDYKLICEAWK